MNGKVQRLSRHTTPRTQNTYHKRGWFLCELRIVYVDGGFLELLVAYAYIDGF